MKFRYSLNEEQMEVIVRALALCDELLMTARELSPIELRRALEEYASAEKQALEVVSRQLASFTLGSPAR